MTMETAPRPNRTEIVTLLCVALLAQIVGGVLVGRFWPSSDVVTKANDCSTAGPYDGCLPVESHVHHTGNTALTVTGLSVEGLASMVALVCLIALGVLWALRINERQKREDS